MPSPSPASSCSRSWWGSTSSPSLTFRGGIVLASVASAVLVMGLVEHRPDGPTALQRVLRHPAATWVGQRSYSIYHLAWPVILLVALDNPSAPGTTSHLLTRLWCVLVTLALADLTFRFVETPLPRARLPRTVRLGLPGGCAA